MTNQTLPQSRGEVSEEEIEEIRVDYRQAAMQAFSRAEVMVAAKARMLPCPNCGETDVDPTFSLDGEGGVNAGCMVCGMTGPNSHTAADSVDRWNALPRRDIPAAIEEKPDGWIGANRRSAYFYPGEQAPDEDPRWIPVRIINAAPRGESPTRESVDSASLTTNTPPAGAAPTETWDKV